MPLTEAVPVTATVQLSEPDTPPAGTVTAKVYVVPDREPETVPGKTTRRLRLGPSSQWIDHPHGSVRLSIRQVF